MDVVEAFAATDIEGVFIKPAYVLKARKRPNEIPDAPLIIGVDPAGSGGDRFAVAFRRGDCIFKIDVRHKLEHDEAVAFLSAIIDEWHPNRMCIDRGSMGQAIISSLRALKKEYADIVKGIDFGGTSKAKLANPKRAGPWNIRAEIYGRLLDFIIEGGSIPDNDDLATDMSGPKIKYRANNDWLLESKTDMKARGLISCDLSDACALTFSVQEFFDTWSKPKPVKGFATGAPAMIGHNGGSMLEDPSGMGFDYGASDHGWMG